jgi:hypothetical protein
MANFLFWNTNKKNVLKDVAAACREREVDVLILAECAVGTVTLLQELNEDLPAQKYLAPFDPAAQLRFVTRYPPECLRLVYDERGVAVRLIRPPVGVEVLLVALHLPSRRHQTAREQAFNAVRVSQKIIELETQTGLARTLVIGDLNMDPFDEGVVAADGFHGVMDRSIAKEVSRTVSGKERKFFYNPMWSRYGDETAGPPGTYFYRGNQITHFWHMFDQVLLRPSLLDYYAPSALEIIDSIAGRSLLRNGRVDKSISDHLPIFLRLNLERGV